MGKRIVVIGGVAAGMSAASKAKRVDRDAEVTVYTDETYISYSACSLPYLAQNLISDESELVARTPQQMKDYGVDVHTGHRVTKILRGEKQILVSTPEHGQIAVPYDKLVIATGARNIVPPFPGVDAAGIFTIKGIPDIHRLQAYLAENGCRSAVVVGGGFIGLEMADALCSLGLGVTILDAAPQVLPILDADMAERVRAYVESKGVQVRCGQAVTGFTADADGRVSGVATGEGVYPADVVILAIGLVPNTALAGDCGLALGFKNAVRTDASMRTSDPDIYAAGDCAETYHIVSGQRTNVCLGTLANRNGRIAGENAAGGHQEYRGEVGTAMLKVFEKEVAKTGLSEAEAVRAGLRAWSVSIDSNTRASGYPGRGPITVKLVIEAETNRLLGGQIFGAEGAAARINAIAAMVQYHHTVEELAALDMGYAPPFSPVWDPVLVAAGQAVSRMRQRRE